jgi:ketosteroid isomerase-like protein
LFDHFGMNIRSLFVCSALLLFASVAYSAGSYQRTRDGKALIWNDSPKLGEEATWSGKRDKKGFAVGSGTLTWYKVVPTLETGSLIPDTRRHVVVVKRYSGKMVHGKFKGAVTYVDANGRRRSVNLTPRNRRSPRKEATRAPTPAVTVTPTAEQTPNPTPQQTATPTPERALAPATPTPIPAPEQSPSPAAQQTATEGPEKAATMASEQTATPTSQQQARQPDAQSTHDSLRSRTAPPSALPKPPPTLDVQTVAALDTLYQEAVKANDIEIMDRILADDFVLETDRGPSLTKADLVKEAREKQTTYEQHEQEEGTQRVRVWRDTAVVTALLRTKGTRDQNPFDYKAWVSETYVRTPTGWRCVFGQVSMLKPDAK